MQDSDYLWCLVNTLLDREEELDRLCPACRTAAEVKSCPSCGQPVADSEGSCPLRNVVRVANFGSVQLSSSFLASCPLALSSALYIEQQAKPLTRQLMASDLRQIDHLGSFACRNIYHRQQARRSEHATADALDVSGFRLADGRRVSVLQGWRSETSRPWLAALLSSSCHYFGNALGPEYNAAHANHFHFGMRGQGFCF